MYYRILYDFYNLDEPEDFQPYRKVFKSEFYSMAFQTAIELLQNPSIRYLLFQPVEEGRYFNPIIQFYRPSFDYIEYEGLPADS